MKKKVFGFTLIELLAVMAIVAVLAGILLPAFNIIIQMSWKTRAKEDIHQITTAWHAYLNDYRVFPTDPITDECITLTEMDLLAVEILQGLSNNVRGLFYMEFSTNHMVNGMLDPWGDKAFKKGSLDWQNRRYQFVIDNGKGYDSATRAYDGKINVPHISGDVYLSAFAWSRGPDGKDATDEEREDDAIGK